MVKEYPQKANQESIKVRNEKHVKFSSVCEVHLFWPLDGPPDADGSKEGPITLILPMPDGKEDASAEPYSLRRLIQEELDRKT